MEILSIVLTSFALATDAFAVSVSSGIISNNPSFRKMIRLAFFFGFFQFIMPVIGYFIGNSISAYIVNIDHWIAFALLAFIGIRMIIETIKEHSDHEADSKKQSENADPFSYKTLFVMAVATSIDALAVGISFALDDANVWKSSVIIGVITFILSFIGVKLGNKVGKLFQKSAGIIGGIVLIGIGLKILLEHLLGNA